jgi:hypothetical protein
LTEYKIRVCGVTQHWQDANGDVHLTVTLPTESEETEFIHVDRGDSHMARLRPAGGRTASVGRTRSACPTRSASSMAETTQERLEYLRGELRAGTMSYGELAELQSLADQIDPGDVELLEAAGVPEFPDEGTKVKIEVTVTFPMGKFDVRRTGSRYDVCSVVCEALTEHGAFDTAEACYAD